MTDDVRDTAPDDEYVVDQDAVDRAMDESAAEGSDAVEQLRDLVVWLIEELVDDADRVSVEAVERGSAVQIQVRMPEEDLGKVIGRGGRIAKAIRTALSIAGSRHHLRVSLDIEGQE
ncbi:MAG TPA: KH domain-containing protein [Thermomicrobiales bacterium]|nr:KH domain-containing protein [Thermomicrobiales bacterium]